MLLDGVRIYRVRAAEQVIAPGASLSLEYAWRTNGWVRGAWLADQAGTVVGSSGLEVSVYRTKGSEHWAADGTRPAAVGSGAMRAPDDWEWMPLDQPIAENDRWRIVVTNRGPAPVTPYLFWRLEDTPA